MRRCVAEIATASTALQATMRQCDVGVARALPGEPGDTERRDRRLGGTFAGMGSAKHAVSLREAVAAEHVSRGSVITAKLVSKMHGSTMQSSHEMRSAQAVVAIIDCSLTLRLQQDHAHQQMQHLYSPCTLQSDECTHMQGK